MVPKLKPNLQRRDVRPRLPSPVQTKPFASARQRGGKKTNQAASFKFPFRSRGRFSPRPAGQPGRRARSLSRCPARVFPSLAWRRARGIAGRMGSRPLLGRRGSRASVSGGRRIFACELAGPGPLNVW